MSYYSEHLEANSLALLGEFIPAEHRDEVAGLLPSCLHIAGDKRVRYRGRGNNPKSRAMLDPSSGFKPGQSGFAGRRHITHKAVKRIEAAVQDSLHEVRTLELDGHRYTGPIMELLPILLWSAIKRCAERGGDTGQLQRLIGECRREQLGARCPQKHNG